MESIKEFCEELKNETWENICSVNYSNDINDIFNTFLRTFLIKFERCFPLQYVTRKREKKIIIIG